MSTQRDKPSNTLMPAPIVSVIVIFLDEERFLREAIESILTQRFQDFELILVDDGSSDRSPEIARSYASQQPDRIRYVHHPEHRNRGMSASRNLGLVAARGRYVGFLDADDAWLPDKLADQVAILDSHLECGLVYGRTLIWRSWQGTGEDFFYDLGVAPDRPYPPPRLFTLLLENKAQNPTTCNALIRRDLIAEVGGFEENFGGMFEDQAFFAKALLRRPAFVSGRVWAKYRQHERSCSSRSAAAGLDARARRRLLAWLRRHLSGELTSFPEASRQLARELRENRLAMVRAALGRAIRRWRAK